MLTAIGIDKKYGGVGSVRVDTTDHKEVENSLRRFFDMRLDMVILVRNGSDSPDILDHWEP